MMRPRRGQRVAVKPNTPEWLAWRAQGVTATDAAVILGVSSYNSPFNLWWAKSSERAALADGQTLRERERSARFQFGHDVEPILHRRFLADRLPSGMRLGSGGCWQGKGHDEWMRATPDRILYPKRGRIPVAVVEFKTAAGGDDWGDSDDDSGVPVIPVSYRVQMLQQMYLAGVTQGWLTVLTRSFETHHYFVEAQPGEFDVILEAGADFERSLRAGDAPPVDGHDKTADRLKGRYASLVDETVEVPADLAESYRAAVEARKAADAAEAEAKNLLMAAMGNARYAADPDGNRVVTRIVSWPKRSDAAAVKEALASLAPDFPFAPTVLVKEASKPTISIRAAKPQAPTKGTAISTTQPEGTKK